MSKYIIICTCGKENLEKSSVALAMASNAIAFGHDTILFLQGTAGNMARRGFMDDCRLKPFPPIQEMLTDFMELGGKVIVCNPCLETYQFHKDDLINGVETAGGTYLISEVENAVVLSY